MIPKDTIKRLTVKPAASMIDPLVTVLAFGMPPDGKVQYILFAI
jgi:hypothetical protein